MWGDRNSEEMIEAFEESWKKSNFPGEIQVLRDPKHIEHMLHVMISKQRPKSSDATSRAPSSKDVLDRKNSNFRENFTGLDASGRINIHALTKSASKGRSYKDDKPDFNSHNAFNRCPPPDISPHQMAETKRRVVKSYVSVAGEVNNSTKEKIGREMPDVKLKTNQNCITGSQIVKPLTRRLKKPKRPVKTCKNLKVDVKKRPISQKIFKQKETRMRRYSECTMSTKERVEALSEVLKRDLENEGKSKDVAGEVLFDTSPETNYPLMASMKGSTSEQQQDYLRTLVEMRSRKETTGHLWDSSVIFIDQGLAYNQIAKEKRIWKNRWGGMTSDVNDPAVDAVLLSSLSLGGLILPNSTDQNPFDYTNSFLKAMMEKYPVLCKPDENEEQPDYAACLNKFARTFPLLITTYYIFSVSPKITPVKAMDYGLPPVVYYEGFPSLACQHLLEKGTNIIPFLMIGLLHHLGDVFRDSNLIERLGMARIVWKHLKKMIDSTSLPWVCRESFCRRHGVCKNQAFHPHYLPKRLEAQQHLMSSVAQSKKLYRLLVEIDDFDFRTNCPAANSLAVSIADIHYMNAFYTVAVDELKDGFERDEGKTGDDSDACDSLDSIQRNLRKSEGEIILEAASIKEGGRHISRRSAKKKFVVSLENEID